MNTDPQEAPVRQAGRYLRELMAPYASGYLEIRLLRGKAPSQTFVPLPIAPSDLKALCEEIVQKAQDGYDVYAGVLPRALQSGKAAAVEQAATVWADLDYKNLSREDVEIAVADADLVVYSGGGAHAYWWTETVPLNGKTARDAFSDAVAEHQQTVSGGKADSTHDLVRILRVPGTLNWKDRANPKPVTLGWCLKRTRKAAGEPEPAPDPTDPQWEAILEAWSAAEDWSRARRAALQDALPELHPAFRCPSRRLVGDPNVFIRGVCQRYAAGLPCEDDERDTDALLAHLRENGVAY